MPLDVSGLKEKVRAHGQALVVAALVETLLLLDEVVPDSDKNPNSGGDSGGRVFGQKLRDSRETTAVELQGDIVSVSVTYTSPKAELTNIGPDAHQIPTGGRAAQLAKGYPMRFFSPSAGEFVRAFEVNWVPGPGVEANRGWFTRGLARWSDHLQDATTGVQS